MSHLRFYRAILSHELADADAATVELHAATLSLNKHGFCTTFPVSRSSFTNTSKMAKLFHI